MRGAAEGRVPREGFDLHYRTEGSGTPAVLLSGGPGLDVDYMAGAAEHLPSSYRRILLEQRGTGRSRPPKLSRENATLPLAIDDLEALRMQLEQDRLLLVGHSWGAMLAMAYAAKYRRHVDRMLLIGPGGMTSEFFRIADDNIRSRLHPQDLEAQLYWGSANRRGIDADKAGLEVLRAIMPSYLFDRDKALEFAAQLPEGTVHADASRYLRVDLGEMYDLRESLWEFDQPVAIVRGHQDPVAESTTEETHRVLKSSTLAYIHKCGHFPWLEQPAEFHRIVHEFLAGI
jgi:proline iminopeptidase